MIDITRMLAKIVPEEDGEDVLRKRTGTVVEINADSTVDVSMDGVTVENVPALASAVVEPGGTVEMLSYRGGLLILGSVGRMPELRIATSGASAPETGTTTSGTFVTSLTTSGSFGISFVAPPSGIVQVTVKAAAQNNTANGYALLDFQVREGATVNAGTIIRGTDDNTAGIIRSGTASLQTTIMSTDLIFGLTPGSTYNVTLAYQVNPGTTSTGQYQRRFVLVQPQ